ncbi:MAG: 30S ribosomal protein S17 [Syntrophomonadaceae bacterium]|nr:30S ribosomal protein S17 [Syntrophomonadaceae bacterium]
MAENRGQRRVKIGKVVSNKMDKTVTVRVESVMQHSLYKKTVRRSKKYKAHDEHNQCNIGDLVKIMETRPLSKDKRWRVVEVLERAKTLQ